MHPAPSSKGIEILMAVHQPDTGFLEKQVDSIRRQTHPDWRLCMMLDGEHPELVETISRWTAGDARIRCVVLPGHSGCCRTFEKGLLRLLETDCLIALADQDDVWEPSKLEELAAVFQQHPETLMAFCDSSIIDDRDEFVSHSLHQSEERVPEFSLISLWARNSISGHAQMFQSRLLRSCMPFPAGLCESGLNHDHWLAMAAAHQEGAIRFLDKVLVHHRLHDCNQIGPRLSKAGQTSGGVTAWRLQNRRLRATLQARHGFLRQLPAFPYPRLGGGRLLACAAAAMIRGNPAAAGIYLRAFCSPAP